MNNVFCTLFNHYYLDKGLVLFDSLKDVTDEFRLYILCMDDKCFEILSDLSYKEIVPVKLADFEDEEMLHAKTNRSFGEYFWTCSSSFILYVLKNYKEPICTYIDADMYFYNDPKVLIDEMINAGKSVMITPHNFSARSEHLKRNGLYCVEFNSFLNEENSLKVLKKWKADCLDCCTSINDGVHFGDQKYLDDWTTEYPNIVHVCQNPGAGVAPWNIDLFELSDNNKFLRNKKDNCDVPLIFYHYQEISYLTRKEIMAGLPAKARTIDYRLVSKLYTDYLYKIEEKKQFLEKVYEIDYLIKKHPAKDLKSNWKLKLLSFGVVKGFLGMLNPAKYKYNGYFVVKL